MSPPASLPDFNSLRDEILSQLELRMYVAGAEEADRRLVDVAAGLAPEVFMLNLLLAGVALYGWLGEVLVGKPNATHHALAQLAFEG